VSIELTIQIEGPYIRVRSFCHYKHSTLHVTSASNIEVVTQHHPYQRHTNKSRSVVIAVLHIGVDGAAKTALEGVQRIDFLSFGACGHLVSNHSTVHAHVLQNTPPG